MAITSRKDYLNKFINEFRAARGNAAKQATLAKDAQDYLVSNYSASSADAAKVISSLTKFSNSPDHGKTISTTFAAGLLGFDDAKKEEMAAIGKGNPDNVQPTLRNKITILYKHTTKAARDMLANASYQLKDSYLASVKEIGASLKTIPAAAKYEIFSALGAAKQGFLYGILTAYDVARDSVIGIASEFGRDKEDRVEKDAHGNIIDNRDFHKAIITENLKEDTRVKLDVLIEHLEANPEKKQQLEILREALDAFKPGAEKPELKGFFDKVADKFDEKDMYAFAAHVVQNIQDLGVGKTNVEEIDLSDIPQAFENFRKGMKKSAAQKSFEKYKAAQQARDAEYAKALAERDERLASIEDERAVLLAEKDMRDQKRFADFIEWAHSYAKDMRDIWGIGKEEDCYAYIMKFRDHLASRFADLAPEIEKEAPTVVKPVAEPVAESEAAERKDTTPTLESDEPSPIEESRGGLPLDSSTPTEKAEETTSGGSAPYDEEKMREAYNRARAARERYNSTVPAPNEEKTSEVAPEEETERTASVYDAINRGKADFDKIPEELRNLPPKVLEDFEAASNAVNNWSNIINNILDGKKVPQAFIDRYKEANEALANFAAERTASPSATYNEFARGGAKAWQDFKKTEQERKSEETMNF